MRTRVRNGMAAIALVLAAMSATSTLQATVIVPADIKELTEDALAIARGRVVAVDARWSDGRRTIETLVTLETDAYLKGGLGETLQFRVPGGTLGRYTNLVVGAPRFAVGQHVIVFLGAKGPMVPYVLGLSQGVFHVSVDAGGLLRVTAPALPEGVGRVVRGAAPPVPSLLSDFERHVRTLAGGSR